MKKVAYIASECVPFIKTGGLADVVGTLPKIFDKNEYDVRVIMPNYLCIPNKYREKMQYITHFYMDIGYKNDYVGVMYLEYEGVKVYFIDNEYYFNGFTPYGDVKWDIEKFCYFSKAALSILPSIGFQPDILHCHDWQAGLVPVYLKTLFAGDMFYTSMKSVMTIHNLQFQGKWDIKTIQEYSGLPDYVFTPDKLEIQKDASMLKGGLVYADKITTVSNTYAKEIQTPYYGEGLDGLLSARWQSLWGVSVRGAAPSRISPLCPGRSSPSSRQMPRESTPTHRPEPVRVSGSVPSSSATSAALQYISGSNINFSTSISIKCYFQTDYNLLL